MRDVKFSEYILSGCCSAPVVQVYNWGADAYPTWCVKCYTLLGAPGREDFHPSPILKMIRVPDMSAFMEGFTKSVQEAGKGMKLIMDAWGKSSG